MSEEEKEKYCIQFIYKILNEKTVFNRFYFTSYGNIDENKTVTLYDCIDYIVEKLKKLEEKEGGEKL